MAEVSWNVDDWVVEAFREFVKEVHGTTYGNLGKLQRAMIEYMDADRAARTEDIVRENQEKLEEVLALLQDDSTHAHTTSTSSASRKSLHSLTQPEKTDILVDYLDREFDAALSMQELETAIEEAISVGGRTQADYKERLQKRGELFADPRGDVDVWYRSQEEFFGRVRTHAANTSATYQEILDAYDQSVRSAYKEWLKDELAAEIPDRLRVDSETTEEPFPVSTSQLEDAITSAADTGRWVDDIGERIREYGILEKVDQGWTPPDWQPRDAENAHSTSDQDGPDIARIATDVAQTILDDRDAWPAETAYVRAILRRETDYEGIDVDDVVASIRDQDLLEEQATNEWVPASTENSESASTTFPTSG
ncbi:hypothetical protein [Halospeciosus flavus]|uniref:hypothetical protein n=1 Tax=Halospeciosus flavus TaxID=3032283 RepID=UPI0036199CD7